MAKRLTSTVHVVDKDGETQVFGPSDQVPAWAWKQITNPAAFTDDESGEPEPDDDAAQRSGRRAYRSDDPSPRGN